MSVNSPLFRFFSLPSGFPDFVLCHSSSPLSLPTTIRPALTHVLYLTLNHQSLFLSTQSPMPIPLSTLLPPLFPPLEVFRTPSVPLRSSTEVEFPDSPPPRSPSENMLHRLPSPPP